MKINNSAIQLLITKFYSSIGLDNAQKYSAADLVVEIENYFNHDKKSTNLVLQKIMTDFNRPDNPYLQPDFENRKGAGQWLLDQIKSFFSEMFPSVWEGFSHIIENLYNIFFTSDKSPIYKATAKNFMNMLESFKKIGFLDDEAIQNIKHSYVDSGNLSLLSYVSVLGGLLFSWVQIMSGTIGGDYIKRASAIYTPAVPSAEGLINGLRIAPELKDRFIKAFKENGLSDNDIELMLISAYRLYDVDTIKELYLRGNITHDKMLERMGELGFTPERIKELVSLWEIIPPVNDLLYMVAKEAFEPDQIKYLGLDSDFPEDVSPWLTKQGLSKDWQLKYWYAHWNIPSIQQAFEMYHRRIIDGDMLNILFKTVEIPPLWRDKLTQIAFNPYTRVDIRRMHAMGSASEKEVYENYLDLGYDSEHAQKMTEWTIAYNANSNRTITKTQIETSYRDDVITRKEAIEYLMSMGYNEKDANFSIDYVDYEEEKSYQDNIIDIIKDSYSSNLMSKNEAISKLNTLNLSARKISYLIERWTIRQINNRKLPSKSDLDKFVKSEIITITQYKEQLRIIGYENKYIKWYGALIEKAVKAG